MQTKIILKRSNVLESYARRVPNADKVLIDYGRDSLLVQFGNIHANEYKISEILEKATAFLRKQGYTEINFI